MQPLTAEELLAKLPGIAYQCTNDAGRTMVQIHGRCETLTGYQSQYFLRGRHGWSTLIHEKDQKFVLMAIETALATDAPFDIQYRIIKKSGRVIWVRDQGGCISGNHEAVSVLQGYVDDITPLIGVNTPVHGPSDRPGLKFDQAIDISARIKSEKEIGRNREQLAHADRLYALGEMATGIAHEINQPLAAISLFAQAGRRLLDTGEYDSFPEIFDKLSQHAQRAGTIVERIQDLAQRKERGRQLVDLNALTKDVVELADIDAQTSNIDIDLHASAEPLRVEVDVVQIQQVILNLLRNAIDAMRSLDYANGNTIRVRIRHSEAFVEVSVTDSGAGVATSVVDNIFEPFATTKSAGLGMGLPISKAIVTAHGGQLTFRNEKSGGATFAFTLPVVSGGK